MSKNNGESKPKEHGRHVYGRLINSFTLFPLFLKLITDQLAWNYNGAAMNGKYEIAADSLSVIGLVFIK